MARFTRWEVWGWLHPAMSAPTMLVGRYRWHWRARLSRWWFCVGELDAHAWIKEQPMYTFVENGKAIP